MNIKTFSDLRMASPIETEIKSSWWGRKSVLHTLRRNMLLVSNRGASLRLVLMLLILGMAILGLLELLLPSYTWRLLSTRRRTIILVWGSVVIRPWCCRIMGLWLSTLGVVLSRNTILRLEVLDLRVCLTILGIRRRRLIIRRLRRVVAVRARLLSRGSNDSLNLWFQGQCRLLCFLDKIHPCWRKNWRSLMWEAGSKGMGENLQLCRSTSWCCSPEKELAWQPSRRKPLDLALAWLSMLVIGFGEEPMRRERMNQRGEEPP